MLKTDHYKKIPLTLLSESAIEANECIIGCLEVLDAGSGNSYFINESDSYLSSIMMENLKNVKALLISIYDKVLEYFSTYLIKSVSVLKKLKDKIYLLDDAAVNSLRYTQYEYPRLHLLPKTIKKDITAIEKDATFKKVLSMVTNSDKIDFSSNIDAKIEEFASEVLDCRVKFAGDPIEKVIEEKAISHMRGERKSYQLTKDVLKHIIDGIIEYKDAKKQIIANRADIISYYERLKTAMESTYETKTSSNGRDIRSLYDASIGYLKDEDVDNLSFGMLEANRLYGSYIQIYRTVFKVKLDIIKERVDMNKALIRDLLKLMATPEGLRLPKEMDNGSLKY